MKRYAIVVFWSEEDKCWVADVPDLKSCSSRLSTRNSRLSQKRPAAAEKPQQRALLDTCSRRGRHWPTPQAHRQALRIPSDSNASYQKTARPASPKLLFCLEMFI